MSEPPPDSAHEKLAATLVVRRRIHATPEKLFAAWTEAQHLVQWWGPQGVACPAAEIDLRVGGAYRIANRFPDGTVVWIAGVSELIQPPHRLIYTWKLGAKRGAAERVTLHFERVDASTEVIVTHERIADQAARTSHERGWARWLHSPVRYEGQL